MFNYSNYEIAQLYISDRILEKRYEQQITRLSQKVEKFRAKDINRYLKARAEKVSSITLANERRVLLTLWAWAYESHLVAEPPRGVMRITPHRPPVSAWNITTCQQIVQHALKKFPGEFKHGLSKGKFLATWCLLAYETGARYGDIMAWGEKNIDGNNISWTVSKTGVPLSRKISDHCLTLVKEMLEHSTDSTILGWVCCRRYGFYQMRCLLKDLGIAGSGKWFRRTAGTQAELAQPGSGNLMLGHKTRSVFLNHYYDTREAHSRLPTLPQLMD